MGVGVGEWLILEALVVDEKYRSSACRRTENGGDAGWINKLSETIDLSFVSTYVLTSKRE